MRESIKQYAVAVAKRWWAMAFGFIGIIGLFIDLRKGFDLTVWIWISVIVVPLFIAQFLAYQQLWFKLEQPSNWISAYERKHGKLPPIPSFVSGLVLNYSPGMIVSRNIQLITPSAQFWNKLDPSQQDQLLELAEWLGQDRRDYLARMKRMAPPGKSSMRLLRR